MPIMFSSTFQLALAIFTLFSFAQPYTDCPNLAVSQVGFNYVIFSGNLSTTSAYRISLTNRDKLIFDEKPLFSDRKPSENPESISQSGLVPLLQEDGFQLLNWYVVCGKNHENCEECVIVRYCDCDCDSNATLFYNGSIGTEPDEYDWEIATFFMSRFKRTDKKILFDEITNVSISGKCSENPPPNCSEAMSVNLKSVTPATSWITTISSRTGSGFHPPLPTHLLVSVWFSLNTSKLSLDNPNRTEGVNVPEIQNVTTFSETFPVGNMFMKRELKLYIPYENEGNFPKGNTGICRNIFRYEKIKEEQKLAAGNSSSASLVRSTSATFVSLLVASQLYL